MPFPEDGCAGNRHPHRSISSTTPSPARSTPSPPLASSYPREALSPARRLATCAGQSSAVWSAAGERNVRRLNGVGSSSNCPIAGNHSRSQTVLPRPLRAIGNSSCR